jgi:uncharacterized membrane protein
MDALFAWMQGTWINSLVVGYAWTWPTLETLHFLGLCLLIGAVLIMDLRLIGFQRVIPLSAVHGLMPVAIIGFVINLITGVGFLFGDPQMYAANYAFWVKMALVLLAGLNFLLFVFKVEPSLAHLGPSDSTPMSAKAVGAASLVFWFGVLAYGRLLPYLGTGGG